MNEPIIEETIAALDALRIAFPEQNRVLLYVWEHPNDTQAEIAAALGCTQQNVSKQMREALCNLNKIKKRRKPA